MAQQRKIEENEFDINNPRCIKCNSKNLKSIGRNKNRRRYQCQDCRKCFKGDVYKATLIHKDFDISNSRCVSCNSKEITKYGRLNGRQRYLCKTCEQHFLGEVIKLRVNRPHFNSDDPRCVYCNSINIKRKGADSKTKRQRYACNDCSKIFVGELYIKTPRVFAYKGNGCPKCRSHDVKPHGSRPYSYKSKLKRKRKFFCNNCGRTFVENPKYQSFRHILSEATTPEEMFAYDIWDVRILGLEPTVNGGYTLNFSNIEPEWLKLAAKEWIKFKSVNNSCSTLC